MSDLIKQTLLVLENLDVSSNTFTQEHYEYISEEEYNALSPEEQTLYERTEKSLGKRAADMHNAASHVGYGQVADSSRKQMAQGKKDFRKIGKSISKTHGADVAKQAKDAAVDRANYQNAMFGKHGGTHKAFHASLSGKEKKAYDTRTAKHGLSDSED